MGRTGSSFHQRHITNPTATASLTTKLRSYRQDSSKLCKPPSTPRSILNLAMSIPHIKTIFRALLSHLQRSSDHSPRIATLSVNYRQQQQLPSPLCKLSPSEAEAKIAISVQLVQIRNKAGTKQTKTEQNQMLSAEHVRNKKVSSPISILNTILIKPPSFQDPAQPAPFA